MKKLGLMVVVCFAAILSTCCFNTKALFAEIDVEGTYQMVCVLCHGADGTGSEQGKKFKVPDFTDKEWQASITDEKMIKRMIDGSDNPNYGEGVIPLLEMVGIEDPEKAVGEFVPKIRAFAGAE